MDLWRIDLDAPGAPDAGWPLLDEAERARAKRYLDPRHGERFAAARGALRALLGACLAADPRALRFALGPHGKPALAPEGPVRAGAPLAFNLSHTGGVALLAITGGPEVGVDVEIVRRGRDLEAIAERFFAPDEAAAVLALAGEARALAFYDVWTRKEAYIKAIGRGLAMPLDRFSVSIDPGEARLLAHLDDPREVGRWAMRAVDLGPDLRAALCVEAPLGEVGLRTWRPGEAGEAGEARAP